MYRYDEFDTTLVNERVEQFRRQAERRLAGDLTEDQFKPLRLMNGLYLQLHAYMLRINVPYGALSANQMRKLAYVARTYDKGYGHFTTRQNIQYNWIQLKTCRTHWPILPKLKCTAFSPAATAFGIRPLTSTPVWPAMK